VTWCPLPTHFLDDLRPERGPHGILVTAPAHPRRNGEAGSPVTVVSLPGRNRTSDPILTIRVAAHL
jgi:hypothetical protein